MYFKQFQLILSDSQNTYVTYITHIICLAHVIYITHIIYITNIHNSFTNIFKASEKTYKIYFINFFLPCITMTNNYYKNTQRKTPIRST